MFDLTLADRRRVLGDDHLASLRSMNNLAEVRRAVGDLHGARDLLEQARAARQQVLGDDHPATVDSMNALVAIRRKLDEP